MSTFPGFFYGKNGRSSRENTAEKDLNMFYLLSERNHHFISCGNAIRQNIFSKKVQITFL